MALDLLAATYGHLGERAAGRESVARFESITPADIRAFAEAHPELRGAPAAPGGSRPCGGSDFPADRLFICRLRETNLEAQRIVEALRGQPLLDGSSAQLT